jgi:hypothetical protein
MAINLDRRIIPQTQLSGLKQVDASPFVDAGNKAAQFGRDIQNLGVAAGEYLAQQQALHNDNLKVQGEQNFTKKLNAGMQNAEFGELQADGTRKLPEVTDMGPKAVKAMVKQQLEILKNIPKLRRPGFLKTTNAQILAAQNKLAGLANTRVKADARGLDIDFKNDLEANAVKYTPKYLESQKQEYLKRLARGVLTGAYLPDAAARLEETFKEDLADTLQNAKTTQMFQGEFTVEDLERRTKEIGADPDLDPKEISTRIDSIWRRSSAITAKRQTALAAVAKEKSTNARIALYDTLIADELNPDGTGGPQQEDLDQAIEDGLRHAPTIMKFQKMINQNEKVETLGLDDNSPAQGYLDELGTLESKALDENWTDIKLSKHVRELQEKVRNEHANSPLEKLTSKELTTVNAKANSLVKAFKDEGKRNTANAKSGATQTLKLVFGGTDKAFEDFNFLRNELLSDSIQAAHRLIDGGMDEKTAVEKIRSLVEVTNDEGIVKFDAATFSTMIKKARAGTLSETERYNVGQMILRQKDRIADRAKSAEADKADALKAKK